MYLDCASNRAVHPKGEKAVSIMVERSTSMNFTLAVTIEMDGSKLSSYAIFQGTSGGSVKDLLFLFYRDPSPVIITVRG